MALLLVMAASVLPLSGFAEGTEKQYGYVVIRNDSKNRVVNFRRKPNTNDDGNFPIARLPEGWVVEILGEETVNGAQWYRASANTNTTGAGAAKYENGYLLAEFVECMTAEEQAAWLVSQPQIFSTAVPGGGTGDKTTPTPTPTGVPDPGASVVLPGTGTQVGYVRMIVDKVNLRQTPAGKVLNEKNQIPLGTAMAYYAITAQGGYDWVLVIYDGMSGYVRSDCYAFCDENGNLITITPTPSPTPLYPVVTEIPAATSGYVKLTVDKVAIRQTPGGTVLNDNKRLPQGRVLAYTETVTYGGYDWVKVTDGGLTGYVRSDCYVHCDVNGTPVSGDTAITPTPTVVPVEGARYVRLKANKEILALRSLPDTNATILNGGLALPNGAVLRMEEELLDVNSYDWAKVTYNGQTGYVPSTDYFECTAAGKPVGDAGINGFVVVTAANVKLVSYPDTAAESTAPVIPVGTTLTWASNIKATSNGKEWIYVYCDLGEGFICETDFAVSDAYVVHTFATAAPGIVPSVPGTTSVPSGPVTGYVILVADKVAMRQTPGGTVINDNKRLSIGTVMGYTDVPVSFGGYDWVLVTNNGMTGYVRSDCYVYCDKDGVPVTTATPVPGTTPTDPGVIETGTYGRINMDNVFFRKSMNTNGDFWARLPINWTVEILGSEVKGNITWYKVKSGTPANPTRTYTGFIHGSYLTVIGSVTPTPAVPVTDSSYAVITLDGINVRQTPGGAMVSVLRSNTVVNVIARPAGSTANDWFFIERNGVYGYVPATALRVLVKSELDNFVLPGTPVPTVTPSPTPSKTGTGYVKLILDNVNIRKTPGGTVLTPTEGSKLRIGLVLPYMEGPVASGNYEWVKVSYGTKIGYIRSDCYQMCDASGNPVLPTPTPTPEPGVPGQQYIRLTKGGVNLRSGPWVNPALGQLNKGTILPYFNTILNGSEIWYSVYSSQLNTYGYILGTMAVECDANGNQVIPTLAPTTTPGGSYTGYVATSVSSVWLRESPSTDAGTAGKVNAKGTVLPMTGAPVVNGIYSWYPVQMPDGTRGYLRGDCVFQLADWQLAYYQSHGVCPTPTPGPATPPPGNSDYIITTADKLWVRRTPSKQAETLGQLALNTVTKFFKKETVGNVLWYQISYNGQDGWVHGDFARVMSNAEYYQWKGTTAPTAVPTAMPDPSTFSDVAITTIERVKIRASAAMNGRELTVVYAQGTKLSYLGKYTAPTASNPYYWFNVKYGGVSGWMRGDCVRVLTKEEKRVYELTGDPDAAREATYRTLSKNDTGEDVKALQLKLVEKGYLSADQVNGVYLTSTEAAVIAFQRANGLTADGIAGEKTQHALFGTVPAGTYDGSSATATLYPVEYVDWYKGDIQSIWKVGTVAVITDVYTGISFNAQRLYGDNHADCEPRTTLDTAAICQIFGVSNAQEISDREQELQSWRRRPLWVTIGGRTFAASMYGIPHNYSGDRIPDNNYNGQFCVHFTNSKTHTTNIVDVDASYNGYFGHQSAIKYAYTHSISGTK